ncbi:MULTISPECIES: hypothetical protein [unclassified Modestobacter]|uniref:hypothetical protein n=1 Tax=unclassified Modestobacter TaxID=2643866 RepID=UPI0022AA62A9|nr:MULTISPECIES: hypothetical protein [unclassified Modestobacter]MCZ2826872.1 hypothetical protein [Modestobacter sp. VKM Ac-2981]MCZ2855432.1 hypothetical protein [Modestobacter sp. VKM Ac-2982]
MKIRTTVAALALSLALPLAACGTTDDAATASTSTTSTESTSSTDATPEEAGFDGGMPGGGQGGPGGSVDVSSVTTEEELVELVQDAYGDPSLDLHRGHQPVEDVLDEVLGITHEELHVRMEAGQGLAEVAEDLGIDPQELVDGMVAKYAVAIDTLLADGTITEEEADQYRADLETAFEFRVTWDGEAATPTYTGLSA